MKEDNTKSNDKKVIVVGGGPAGLTASYQLSKTGVESIVLEKDQLLGGISRTVNYKNYHFDIGGHRFFTKIKDVEDIWKEVLGDDFLKRKRLSRIYYNGKFFYYPLRALNALFGLGIWNSFMILVSFLYAKILPFKPVRGERAFHGCDRQLGREQGADVVAGQEQRAQHWSSGRTILRARLARQRALMPDQAWSAANEA